MKILCLVLLSVWKAAGEQLEMIDACKTKCTKGLHCRNRPNHSLVPTSCENPADNLSVTSVFRNISLSAVMSCRQRQDCSLHLRIQTILNLTDSIYGLYICTASPGSVRRCQKIIFSKGSRKRMSGLEVQIKTDCTDLHPNQQVQVTVETWPLLCDIIWTETYKAPGCSNQDIRKNIPECITGQLSYQVDPRKKELSVLVTEMLDNKNYNLRLCKKNVVCFDVGTKVVILKEKAVKRAVLPYSRPLPCLCVEGWCDMIDAPRVQVCPFQDRLEELWRGITFDPLEETLHWEPACPVAAVITLCQKQQDGICLDLNQQHSQLVAKEKITFAEVDAHPLLCMKFSMASRSWISCPFSRGRYHAWGIDLSDDGAKVYSHITATFSVKVCEQSNETLLWHNNTHTIHLEQQQFINLNLSANIITKNFCLQMKRVDVKFSVTTRQCFQPVGEITVSSLCNKPLALKSAKSAKTELAYTKFSVIIVAAVVCLTTIILLVLLLNAVCISGGKRRKRAAQHLAVEKQKSRAMPLFCLPADRSQRMLHNQKVLNCTLAGRKLLL